MNDVNPVYDNSAMNDEERNRENMAVTQQTVPAGQVENKAIEQQSGESESLHWLRDEEISEMQSRWTSIQAKFVDEPCSSVEQADALVADTMERIQKAFTNKRTLLDQRWMNQSDISTEDLRTLLQSYRSFLNRLLAL